jgi:hypothetical protein
LNRTLKEHLPEIRRSITAEREGQRLDDDFSVTRMIRRVMDRARADFESKAAHFGLERKITTLAAQMRRYSVREWKRVVNRTLHLQIDLLVSELMTLMQAGAEANQEHTSQDKKYTDEELAEKWKELQAVKWNESDSPSGMILSAPWWIFPAGIDRDDLWEWFGERHSLGVEHLHDLIQ